MGSCLYHVCPELAALAFELMHALRAVTDGRTDTVGPGIPATDNDDVFVFGGDFAFLRFACKDILCVRGQEVHGHVYAFCIIAFDIDAARAGCTAAKNDCIIGIQPIPELRRLCRFQCCRQT